MRIAVYWEQESWGGVDSHLLELLSQWPDPGDEFVLFCNRGNRGFDRIRPDLERLPQVRCVEVGSWSHNELVRRVRRFPAHIVGRAVLHVCQPLTFALTTWRLSRAFAGAGRFDLLLSDNGGYPGAWGCLAAIAAARRAGIPARVLLVHHEARRPAMFMGWYERVIDRLMRSAATAVACVSNATSRSLLVRRNLGTHAAVPRVIHNGIGGRRRNVTPLTGSRPLRSELGDDERLVGIVGRVERYKGHEDVILALARLQPDQRRRLKFVVIGAGEDAEINYLRQVAERVGVADRISFVGYIAGRSVDVIAQLDLLLMATRTFEGFGLTILEAIHSGIPVLATRVGAIPEFLNESIARLVNPCAPEELATALADFLANPEAWRRRAECAQTRTAHTGEAMAQEYRQLFVECMAVR